MTVLIVHAAATWFMVGLIWVIQVVHYPLFRLVSAKTFDGYEAQHTRRMGALLAIPAPVEIITGAVLVWDRPSAVDLWLVLLAGSILAGLWITTAAVHARLHQRLSGGYDDATVSTLVRSNWWRTVGWTLRGALVAAMLFA